MMRRTTVHRHIRRTKGGKRTIVRKHPRQLKNRAALKYLPKYIESSDPFNMVNRLNLRLAKDEEVREQVRQKRAVHWDEIESLPSDDELMKAEMEDALSDSESEDKGAAPTPTPKPGPKAPPGTGAAEKKPKQKKSMSAERVMPNKVNLKEDKVTEVREKPIFEGVASAEEVMKAEVKEEKKPDLEVSLEVQQKLNELRNGFRQATKNFNESKGPIKDVHDQDMRWYENEISLLRYGVGQKGYKQPPGYVPPPERATKESTETTESTAPPKFNPKFSKEEAGRTIRREVPLRAATQEEHDERTKSKMMSGGK